jgi:hypothetical protein
VVRGDPRRDREETLGTVGESPQNLAERSFSGTKWSPVVGSGRKWVKVEESGTNRGGAKTSEIHPGWFFAPTEGLGFLTRSTWASP